MGFQIVCPLSLLDPLAYNYLMPIAGHEKVSELCVVRPKVIHRKVPKATYVLTPARFIVWRLVQMAWQCFRLGRHPEVRAFVSFNPIPYGLLAFPAAKLNRKPIHLGFIGSDWYKYTKGWARWLLPLFRRADFVTATGEDMRREMLAAGFNERQVAILPHSIDLNRFTVSNPEQARYTFIFVGSLIQRKRVDVILEAFALVREAHPEVTLCIVGEGLLAGDLKAQAARLHVEEAVDFIGYTTDVPDYMTQAKILVSASEVEGLPFAIVEGVCCGLVTVTTAVGTITDLITDRVNGLFAPRDNPAALADGLRRLLDEPNLYQELRANVLKTRQRFAYETATAVWDDWLRKI